MNLSQDERWIMDEFRRRGVVKAGHGVPVNVIDTLFGRHPVRQATGPRRPGGQGPADPRDREGADTR